MNTRNYSQKTNYLCGADVLDILPFYAQTLSIPGLNMSIQEIGGRTGARIGLSGNSVEFNELTIDVLLDEDYLVWKELTDVIFTHIDVSTGVYSDFSFNFWTEVTNNLGKSILKIEYLNCRIESIGDLELTTTDDDLTTFSLTIKYDYYNIIDLSTNNNPTLRT